MSFFQAVALGVVQGLTEFIPVSSTAHLILVPWLLGWHFEGKVAFVFDVLLQLGTIAAVVVYFWKDLWAIARALVRDVRQGTPLASIESRLGAYVVLATLPAVVAGLSFKRFFEGLHQRPVAVAAILVGAAGLLWSSERVGRRTRALESLTAMDAFLIGCAQSLALLPGVSRSASTICGGLVLHLARPAAARFSFLMSIPVLLAAGALAVKDLVALPGFSSYLPPLAGGFVASAVVGFVSIHWLLRYLAAHPLNVFAWYRVVAGGACLIWALFR